MAPSLSLAGCLFLTCVFSFANAQPLDESAFKQLSSAELHELDITQNPGLLDLAARTGERVVIDIAGPEQGGVVQDGVNVVLNCSSWLSNFPGGTIMWYRYLYTDIDHTMLGTRDEQIKLELNVPNSLRRIEGEFDEIFNITRVRIQLGAEDPHRGIYECEVCTERGNISEQCHSANITLPIVGRPPILNFTTGRSADSSDGQNDVYRIGSTICIMIDDDYHMNNRRLARVALKCPNVEAIPDENIPPDVPIPTRTWTHTSLDGTITAVMASDQVRSQPRLTDEFRAAFPLLDPINAMNIFVVVTSGDQDTLFFETLNVTRNFTERYDVLQQSFGFWTCKLNNSLGSVEATTFISDHCPCPDIMDFANGMMMMTGISANFTCNPGYELVGAETITCKRDGRWSDPPPVCHSDCPAGTDRVWNIEWPFSVADTTVTVRCGPDLIGNSTRECFTNKTWGSPNVSMCQSKVFFDLKAKADSALRSGNAELVLEVVGDLVNATAAEDRAQFPRDLNTTNDIITNTLDLFTRNLDQANNNTNITALDATVIFEVLDNILSESNQASFDSLQEMGEVGSQAVLNNTETFGLYAARVLDQQMGTAQTLNITGDNMALRAEIIAVDEKTEYSFPSMREIAGLSLPNDSLANISLPLDLLTDRSSVVTASVLFTTLQDLLPTSSTGVGGEVQSLVISSQIAVMGKGGKMSNLVEDSPVIINFQFQLEDIADKTIQCAFWDNAELLSESGWSVKGVTTEKVTILEDVAIVECSSLHLTSFACLVDVGGVQIQSKALSVVSYIGLSLSVTCLLFTIIFYVTFGKKLFSTVHNFVHLNLAIALFAGYLIFAVGVELAAGNEIGCKAVAALIQYFFLSAFCWMMCEGVMLYLMLVMVFSTLSKKWWFFLLLGWGPPVVFVVIGLGAVHDEYGVRDADSGKINFCWLSSGNGTYAIWTFVAPMLAIIIINVVFLVMVLRSLYKSAATHKDMKGETQTDIVKHLLKVSLVLLPLLGLTWVFGLFAVNRNTAVFAWLFTIFNSVQGFFIFIFHVLRNAKMKNTVWKKISTHSAIMKKVSTLTRSSRVTSQKSSSVVLEKKRNLARGIETESETSERKNEAITSQESEMCDVETST